MKKILVIDDDPVGGTLVESRLLKAGYAVSRAINGKQGLDMAKTEKPDLVILDVEMPEMNGYTFIVALRKIESHKDLPVIVLTSHAENEPIFKRWSISQYFVKPVHIDELLMKIATLLAS